MLTAVVVQGVSELHAVVNTCAKDSTLALRAQTKIRHFANKQNTDISRKNKTLI